MINRVTFMVVGYYTHTHNSLSLCIISGFSVLFTHFLSVSLSIGGFSKKNGKHSGHVIESTTSSKINTFPKDHWSITQRQSAFGLIAYQRKFRNKRWKIEWKGRENERLTISIKTIPCNFQSFTSIYPEISSFQFLIQCGYYPQMGLILACTITIKLALIFQNLQKY